VVVVVAVTITCEQALVVALVEEGVRITVLAVVTVGGILPQKDLVVGVAMAVEVIAEVVLLLVLVQAVIILVEKDSMLALLTQT
jgi:hypothetical protein